MRRFTALIGADTREATFKYKTQDGLTITGGGFIHRLRHPLPVAVNAAVLAALNTLAERKVTALIVGGAVRDALLGVPTKDLDIEVYGVSYDDLAKLLRRHGKARLVGRAFGTIKFVGPEGGACDFSIPRLESKVGIGHRGFRTTFAKAITPAQAACRRDFTLNALAYDPLTCELHDYHGGLADLRKRVLRHVSPQFGEDPLRVLRGMQFAARFGLRVQATTARVCRELVDEYHALSRERVAEEWMKWASKSAQPSVIFPYLTKTGLRRVYPELAALYGVPQDPEWHPEGDVDIHTGLVLDAAARIAERDGLQDAARAVLLFAALCHDFGKPETTRRETKRGRERITSPGHEQLSGEKARHFLNAIGLKHDIIRRVVPLVENHLAHLNAVSARSVRRLAVRLAPATIDELLRLIEADHSGRPPLPAGLPKTARRIAEIARQANVSSQLPKPILQGRHLIALGYTPAPAFGPVLRDAFEAQLNGEFVTEEEAVRWLPEYIKAVSPRLISGH